MIGPTMMGGGALAILFGLLLVVGVLLLIIALVSGSRLASPGRPPSGGRQPAPPRQPARACPACRREVQPDWNVCPYCGAELV